MGWGDCGKNETTGDMMGYLHKGKCAQDGCKVEIDHGLDYVCGGMHEGGNYGCGRYFCLKHLTYVNIPEEFLTGIKAYVQVCLSCAEELDRIFGKNSK